MAAIYTMLIVAGFVPFLVVLYKMNRLNRLKKNGIRVMGTVRAVNGSASRSLNSVIIEYPVDGTPETIVKEVPVAGMPYHAGQMLPLYYQPNDPRKMQFDSGKNFIFLLVFTGLIAGFMIAACFFISRSIAAGEM